MIIDTHAHVVPGTLLDALRSERRLFPSVRLDTGGAAPRMAFAGGAPGRPIQPRLSDLAQRRDWLTKARVTARARPGLVVGLSIWWKKFAADGKNANEVTSQNLTDMGDVSADQISPVPYDVRGRLGNLAASRRVSPCSADDGRHDRGKY